MALGNVHLTPQLVQAVRDSVDIVEIASEYTQLKRAGKRHTGLCPLHKEKTPSFSVEPSQGLYYCFGCGRGGDAISLHMELSGDDFPAAIESLAQRYGIPLPTRPVRSGGRQEPDIDRALQAAATFFSEQLQKSSFATDYLAGRKIEASLIESFGLGYAPEGWRNLLEALRGKVSLEELIAAGLVARSQKSGDPYDRFRNRLMFPIHTTSGRIVGFGGRALDDDKAKYINTAETERFAKSRILYGLFQAKRQIREGGRALLVEGYFDVLGAQAAGIEWSVASMGTSLTEAQARLLGRFGDEVLIGYDGDEAGERAAQRAVPILYAQNLSVRRVVFDAGDDPDSVRFEHGNDVLLDRVEQAEDSFDRALAAQVPAGQRLTPQLQAKAARALTDLLKAMPDSVLRYGYARQAADRLGIPVDILWRRVGGESDRKPAPPVQTSSPVVSLEERALQLLLAEDVELPELEELPASEAFLEPNCRAIYDAFRASLSEGQARSARDLAQQLQPGTGAVDHMARILLESRVAPGSGELANALSELNRRWLRQRQRQLTAEIAEAQRAGDDERLDDLLQEKTDLSHRLHRPELD